MKIIKCFALLLYCILSVQAQGKFIIEGKLNDLKDSAMIYLASYTKKGWVTDSMVSKNGVFTFKGSMEMPMFATLFRKDPGLLDGQAFWIDKGKIKVAGGSNLKTATIIGGKNQADWTLLRSLCQPVEDRWSALDRKMAEYNGKDQAVVDEMKAQAKAVIDELMKVEEMFIRTHPDADVSLFWLGTPQAGAFATTLRISLLNGLNQRLRNTKKGKEMAALLAKVLKTDVGQPAPDFTQDNTDGHPVSLASLKGKYVLVDFWASWCGPCRRENPNVVRAYQRFKGRNFEIIGVSLDDKKEAWQKAIKDDGLPWIHVSDLKGWKNAPAQQYGVSGIPSNFLLDPNGIIIARNLQGEALEKKLEEVLTK